MVTLLGQLVGLTLSAPGESLRWSAALSAIVIGVVSHAVAGRFRVPPLVVVVPALVPLLPGLQIYRGLSFISDGDVRGILQLTGAGAITIALAAGVILGEYAAQPLKRNASRIEHRLLAPRMVGVLHSHRGVDLSAATPAPPPTVAVHLPADEPPRAPAPRGPDLYSEPAPGTDTGTRAVRLPHETHH